MCGVLVAWPLRPIHCCHCTAVCQHPGDLVDLLPCCNKTTQSSPCGVTVRCDSPIYILRWARFRLFCALGRALSCPACRDLPLRRISPVRLFPLLPLAFLCLRFLILRQVAPGGIDGQGVPTFGGDVLAAGLKNQDLERFLFVTGKGDIGQRSMAPFLKMELD